MDNEILMVLDKDGYRVLHGHLHLTTLIGQHKEVELHVPGKGNVMVRRAAGGLVVHDGEVSLPVLKM
jgi:hypothetical protein